MGQFYGSFRSITTYGGKQNGSPMPHGKETSHCSASQRTPKHHCRPQWLRVPEQHRKCRYGHSRQWRCAYRHTLGPCCTKCCLSRLRLTCRNNRKPEHKAIGNASSAFGCLYSWQICRFGRSKPSTMQPYCFRYNRKFKTYNSLKKNALNVSIPHCIKKNFAISGNLSTFAPVFKQ